MISVKLPTGMLPDLPPDKPISSSTANESTVEGEWKWIIEIIIECGLDTQSTTDDILKAFFEREFV